LLIVIDVLENMELMFQVIVSCVSENTGRNAGGPSEPVGLAAPIVSLDFLTLSWRHPENSGLSDILGYMIQWNEADSVRF